MDTGLACHALAIPNPDALASHPKLGMLFETAVLAELRKQMAIMPTPAILWHWRSHAGAEVDIVLEYNGRLFPVEVTMQSRPTREKASGIRAFRETYPGLAADRSLILAPVEAPYAIDETTWVMPWNTLGPEPLTSSSTSL
jgi:hypothetical protein